MTAAPPYADYASRNATKIQQHFADWLTEKTGYQVDPTTVVLCKALHAAWQSSPERAQLAVDMKKARATIEQQRAAGRAVREQAAEPAGEKEAAALVAVKAARRPAAKPAPVAEPENVSPAEEDGDEDDGLFADLEPAAPRATMERKAKTGPRQTAAGQPKAHPASRGTSVTAGPRRPQPY